MEGESSRNKEKNLVTKIILDDKELEALSKAKEGQLIAMMKEEIEIFLMTREL